MTFEEDFEAEQAEENRRKKKKGEAEGTGQAKAEVSEAAVAQMKKQFGLPQSRINEILRLWSHLVGDSLAKKIGEFAREGVARASAHLHVQFDLKGGFAVVTDFLSNLSSKSLFGLKSTPDQTPKPR